MTRFKLTIEYDGGPFCGWQRVGDGMPSVQARMEEALERILGVPAPVTGSGRTDAGVHALGQVAHVDVEKPLTGFRLSEALNAHLRPDPIAVLAAEPAPDTFNARFSATQRTYWFRIVNRRADLTLDRGKAWRIPGRLDADAMHAAGQRLLGRHDFSTFRDSQCQANSPIRTLDRLDVMRVGEEVHVWCAARSFLHRQVRSMVGTLVEAGLGKWTAADVAAALAAKDRAACGPVAPPDGLYLARIDYADAPTATDDGKDE